MVTHDLQHHGLGLDEASHHALLLSYILITRYCFNIRLCQVSGLLFLQNHLSWTPEPKHPCEWLVIIQRLPPSWSQDKHSSLVFLLPLHAFKISITALKPGFYLLACHSSPVEGQCCAVLLDRLCNFAQGCHKIAQNICWVWSQAERRGYYMDVARHRISSHWSLLEVSSQGEVRIPA